MLVSKLDWLVIGKNKENALVQRIFNIHCLFGVVIFFINFVIHSFTDSLWVIKLLTLVYSFAYLILYYFSRFRGKYGDSLSIVSFFITLSVLNFSWFLLNGFDGPIVLGFILASVFHSVTFPKKYGVFVPGMFLLNFLFLVFIHFELNHLISNGYYSPTEQYIDLFSLSVISIFLCGVVIIVFRKTYEKDRIALRQKNIELLNTEEELRKHSENLLITNQELTTAKHEAERLHQQKSDFLSTISHEIRTPLNSVIGMARLLTLDGASPEDKKNLSILQFSANNLLNLINDVLDFSKIEAGKITLEELDYDFSKLFHSIVNQFTHLVNEKDIALKINYDKNIAQYLKIDDTRFKQIMYNLISNAIKFTHEGSVECKAKLLNEGEETCEIRIEVKDTGIGIGKERQELIFKAFEQESVAINRKYGGTGLGLSITKELVHLMGGEIKVESNVGGGTCFYFDITLKKGDTVEIDDHLSVFDNELDLSFLNILVVDDNVMNLQLAVAIFKRWNVPIKTADTGVAALDMVKKNKFDFILLDLQMPEMDGYQVAESIISMEKDEIDKTPIIALTASVQQEVKEKALGVGMTDFLSKPFAPEDLQSMIFKYSKVK